MRKTFAALGISLILFVGLVYLLRSGGEPPQDILVSSPVTEAKPAEPIAESLLLPLEETLPEGVNPEFYDSTEVQLGWMNHGLDILNANLPEYATSAKTDNVFFHRGFTGRPMVCGSVEFYRDDTLVMDFQRFIYPGLQVIYYENETRNFDIYWGKVCEQTSDDYLPN